MKVHPQTIYRGKQAEFIVLPIKEYNKIISAFEDLQDIEVIEDFIHKNEETFPISVVLALSEGTHPIRVYREYRGISQTALARKAKVSKQYISQIETGNRTGTTRILTAIAKALKIDLNDIIN